MIDPVQVQKVQRMYERALVVENGNAERALRLVSKLADRVALGGARQRPTRAAVTAALGLDGGR